MSTDPTLRFTDRVGSYALYRPSYPAGIVTLLRQDCGLNAESRIADIGCGTGLLAELFLKAGCEVMGVEPNAGMRESGIRQLAAYPRFHAMDGRAEATGLQAASVDFVTAGQAFHWFDSAAARNEILRILKPAGHLVLVWNERAQGPGFQAAYDAIVRRYAPEINRIRTKDIDTVFGGPVWREVSFENRQVLDLAGLQGRLASSSYAPAAGSPGYQEMLDSLAGLFSDHQREGLVTLLYDTKVYLGRP